MTTPQTRYAKSGDINIAYQVVGEGPFDLVYVPGFVSNIDIMWEEPGLAALLERLASFSRLILFDKRGTGLSDPVPLDALPGLEQRMDDVRAVMDAVGSEQAALLGHSEGGNMSVLFSATYPQRTRALVLVGCYAKRIRSDDYPWAPTHDERMRDIEVTEQTWGSPDRIRDLAPSKVGDEAFQRWVGRYWRQSASPRAAGALLRMNSMIDVRSVLPSIQVPTLLLYRIEDADVKIGEGRYIASRIPGSKLVELDGADHFMWIGDVEALLDEVEEFLTGVRRGPDPHRVLATVLFTDVVGSTETAMRLGDRAWRSLLDRHHEVVRRELERWRGREVDTAGDGFLATFDGPARAIRCAVSATRGVSELGLRIRAGVHTGEVELVGNDVRGIAVHIGSRVSALAEANEVLVSRTVADLVSGSGIGLVERGEHELKGIPGRWQVFAVERA
ncbi:MAG TPA: adenylate/guanylate cyclase domain-containing protein [Actinomycetota bacterium]|nr:adenylate/guanylate cyclase domain-containing protein [Actinomycetota bacterium]